MKIFISTLLLLTALLMPVNVAYANNDQVTICHATSSGNHPWVRIVTNRNGIHGHFLNPGTPKAGHEKDLLFHGEVECPVPPVIPEFGLLPGAIAAIASGGAFLLLKRRASKS